MRHILLSLARTISLVLLCATFAAADELRLTNGDRFTGTVVQLSGGTLTFETAHGALSVAWAEISSLSGRELFVAQQEKLSREAQEDFSKVFGRDFMGAYQAQLRRLKGGK